MAVCRGGGWENRVSASFRPAQPADGRAVGQNAQSCLSVCRRDALSRAHPVFLDGFAVYRLSAVFAEIRANEQISSYDTRLAWATLQLIIKFRKLCLILYFLK